MARESQGLQVLLIIFVMLTVVLGVTTYLYNKQAFEQHNAAVAADAKTQQANTEKNAVVEENKALKTLIGDSEMTTDAIKKEFDDDQKAAGASASSSDADPKQANVMGYHQMIQGLCKTVDNRTQELKQTKDQVASEQQTFKTRQTAMDNAILKVNEGYGTVVSQFKQAQDDISRTEETIKAQMDRDNNQIVKIKGDANAQVVAAGTTVKAAQAAAADARKQADDDRRKLAGLTRPTMDVASGEINWVSVTEKTVWINRGSADALQRQTRFTVYSGDSNDAATAVKKGTIEVTRIVAGHQAECRIIDDKLTDPMMAHDKIFTPLWSPGQQNHFALSGIMNLDGDGRNQVNEVVDLIKNSGGVVDCWLDEQGHREGQVTANTQYIIGGDPPDKSSQETMKNNQDILHDADHYQLQKMTLAEFKQKMNYQKSSSVEQFGTGASSADVERAAAAAKAAKAAKAAAPATKADDKGGDDFGGK